MCTTAFELKLQDTNSRLVKYGVGYISFYASSKEGMMYIDEQGQHSLLCVVNKLIDILDEGYTITSNDSVTTAAVAVAPSCHNIPDQTKSVLKTKMAELEYENAKLQIDIINRPNNDDLHYCQERVKHLEEELLYYKSNVKRNVTDYITNEKLLHDICILLNVDNIESVIPELITLQLDTQRITQLQQDMRSLLLLSLGSCRHDDINIYDPHIWHLARKKTKHNKHTVTGIKKLQNVFEKLFHSIEKDGNHHKRQQQQCQPLQVLNCTEMATIFRHWMKYNKHRKSAEYSVLFSVVSHFQQLFDVHSLSGVYSTMNNVYSKLKEVQSVKRNLSELLGSDLCKSWQSIINVTHKLIDSKDSSLLFSIHEKFPELNSTEILQQLDISLTFYPAFYVMVQELQYILDVHSLSAIIPAVKRLLL